eukprot:4901598-Amphidinium_carterae.1
MSREQSASASMTFVTGHHHDSGIDSLGQSHKGQCRCSMVKMMISMHVFNMPGIGIIAKAMGHLSVPFKSTDVEKFDVDKAEVEKRMKAMDAHIKAGGYGGWFPEGRVNPGSF